MSNEIFDSKPKERNKTNSNHLCNLKQKHCFSICIKIYSLGIMSSKNKFSLGTPGLKALSCFHLVLTCILGTRVGLGET